MDELIAQIDSMMAMTHPRHEPQTYCLALVAKALTELPRQLSSSQTNEVEMSNHIRDFVRELKIFNRNMQDLTNEIRYLRGRM